MLIGYIYKIVNDINDKVYIGQTSETIEKRWARHKRSRNYKKYKHIHFYMALNKYGIDHFFVSEVMKISANTKEELKKELNKWEKYYISEFNSFRNGYNSTEGGDGVMTGFRHTEESKKKMSKSHKGAILTEETRRKMSLAHKGLTFSEETRKILSEKAKMRIRSQESIRKSADKHIGLKMSNKTKQKLKECNKRTILQYDLQNNFITEWDTIKEAANSLGLKSASPIRQCLTGKSKQSHGYIWKYKNGMQVKKKKYKQSVLQYDLNKNFIKEYPSLKSASETCRTTNSAISRCCRGKYKSAGGYIWKYKE